MRKTRIKVRFNLSRGVNYMKWKVKHSDGSVVYYNPTDIQLSMINCQLKNNKNAAEKIFKGGYKVVCAWILCEDINIITNNFTQTDVFGDRLRYNPRNQPNWVLKENNVDNMFFDRIDSVDYGLYIV